MFSSNIHKAFFVSGLTALTYGATYPIAKLIMPEYIKPLGLTLLRVIGATILFWLAGLTIKNEQIQRKDFVLLFLTGLFGASLNMIFLFKGLTYTSAINAAIIVLLAPLFVVLNSHFLLKEVIGIQKIIGIIVGLLGAVIIILKGFSFEAIDASFVGNLLILGSPFFYSFYLIIMKNLVRKYHVFTITKWSLLFGLIVVLPFGYSELNQVQFNLFSISQITSVLFIIIGTSFLVVLFTLYALKHLKASTFSSFMYLQPVFTISIVALIGNDTITLIQIMGMFLVVIGCYLVSNKNEKKYDH
ncbi:DMT family transporter [Tenacibaculum xiamenense]|uniref:DMT family transporter n=1 Tax=Tenacibaculum xiamenense TaxID=1261553 RepID=UPI003895A8EC